MPTSNPLDYLYEEDISGSNPDNKIENELHLVTPGIEAGDFNIIVPKMMPYFKESMVVEHISSGTILVPGVDWQPAHIFDSASFETEWIRGGLYGSLLIMNRNLTGQFRLREYQTLGGGWVLGNDKLLEILSNRITDPRTATYEVVSGKPYVFPPTGHNHPTSDWSGFADVVAAIDHMALAVEQQTQTWLENPPVLMSEYYLKEEAEDVSRDIAEEVFGEKVNDEMASFTAAINNLQGQLTAGLNDRYTKVESDSRYYQKSQLYTRAEVDTQLYQALAGYFSKGESDSRYYLKTETYTRGEMDTRYRQRLTGNNLTYVRDSTGNETGITFTPQATPNTIVSRDESGNLQVGNTAGVDNAVSNARLSVVLGSYFTKTEADSRYYLKAETYTRTELDTRYRQRLTGSSRVYTRDSAGNESSLGYNTAQSGLTLVQRDNNGNFQSGNSTDANDVVNNDRLAGVLVGYYTKAEVYTQAESDSRYYQKSQTYTRTEMDNRYVQTTRSITASTGLTGGGNLTGNITLAIGSRSSPVTSEALGSRNLDTVVTPGFYYQAERAQAVMGNGVGGRNYPVEEAGSLTVEYTNGYIQTYKTTGDHNRTYQRGRYRIGASIDYEWGQWKEVGGDAFVLPNASPTVTGGVRMRVENGVLYITNDGDDA